MALTWSQYNISGTNYSITDPSVTKLNSGWVGFAYSNQSNDSDDSWRFYDIPMTSALYGWQGLTYFPSDDPTNEMHNLNTGSGTTVEEAGIYYGFQFDGDKYNIVYNGSITGNVLAGANTDTMEIYTDGTTVKLKKNGSDAYTFSSAIDNSKVLRAVFTSSQTPTITGATNQGETPPPSATGTRLPPPPIVLSGL